ncbi:acyltransferase family protein [Luteimonas sp. MC1750]|uniref:acyltransferase family protein n=1 Tax=Luteimonas sp. MC1750 TaxID=2799326 RepID=UPI0018F07306|nr:acyltransferase family protein [Luteimonas sp. MC1750]MBJ6984198.1 acyltransferase family protein [Luteimonas sp. MC1750]QQO07014.1 acyltransferase family protein [Luteimonas sp. MC1750]
MNVTAIDGVMARACVSPPVAESTSAVHRRIAGLDGLRAIAVGAVILFHLDMPWARGGYLGVDVFFVLSGFLITGLISGEFERTGQLDLRQFYWRRAKRLLPAVWLVIAAATFASAWVARDALVHLRNDAPASVLFLTNWELVRTQASYFEATGRAPLLQHLWSLAIEEQFYVLWALAVPIGLRMMSRRQCALVTLLLAAGSAAWMAMLGARLGYPLGGDPSRLYFGTDTHGFPLLIGAVLGLVWQPGRVGPDSHTALRAATAVAGVLALAGLLILFLRMGEESRWLYPWGFLAASACTAMLIIVASHPALSLGRWLDAGPMRWLGNRSYGIYLWHWPIFMLTRPGIDLPGWNDQGVLALRLVLTLGVAALSYRFVEMPIRNGALESLWRRRRASTQWLGAEFSLAAITTATAACFVLAGVVLWHAPRTLEVADDVRAAFAFVESEAGGDAGDAGNATGAMVDAVLDVPEVAEFTMEPLPPGQPMDMYSGASLTAVGDSVLLGSSQVLKSALAGADVHATMGWQAADVLATLRRLKAAEALRDVALIHLGTNGYVYEDQLRQILSTLADARRIILVNSQVPRRWMRPNNALMERIAPEFPNVVLMRWNDLSKSRTEYFISDGIHLTPRGQRAFIANAMRLGGLEASDPAADPSDAADRALDPPSLAGRTVPLVLAARPAPPESYWHKLARCETDSDWQGGEGAGGLDIPLEMWRAWGGSAFAATAAEAAPGHQIEVANRIATQGWIQPDGVMNPAVGFERWRCVVAHPPPRARGAGGLVLTYTAESVLAQPFSAGQRGEAVRDLQTILGLRADGIYDRGTRRKHLAYLQQHSLPLQLAGSDS